MGTLQLGGAVHGSSQQAKSRRQARSEALVVHRGIKYTTERNGLALVALLSFPHSSPGRRCAPWRAISSRRLHGPPRARFAQDEANEATVVTVVTLFSPEIVYLLLLFQRSSNALDSLAGQPLRQLFLSDEVSRRW